MRKEKKDLLQKVYCYYCTVLFIVQHTKAIVTIKFYRGEDIFICVWNLHRSPKLWDDADKFKPERWPLDGPNPNETNQNFRYVTLCLFHESDTCYKILVWFFLLNN